ncbi:hypothetical protein [Lacibacter sp. H407]|uniref:hypothetical protein n=1 Tax=Lacibacter sp. H407 TaxID=3133423 RepID=UPI0030C24EE3
MKKIILAVIVLAAAGGALYYYYQTKKPAVQTTTSYQQNIIGEWMIDSVAAGDSGSIGLLMLSLDTNFTRYRFQFKEDGSITQLLNDTVLPLKRTYEWKDSVHLAINEGDSLTDQQSVQVLALTTDAFTIMHKDSSVFYFKKQRR